MNVNIVHTHPKITFFAVTAYCTLQCRPNFYDKKYYSFDTSLTKKWLGLTVGTCVFSSLSVLWQFGLVCYYGKHYQGTFKEATVRKKRCIATG